MSWNKESVIVLVKATPNWSASEKRYTICTAGVNENGDWLRLYPMFWKTIKDKNIKVWDRIEVETAQPEKDGRPESRKIRNSTVKNLGCAIEGREERRGFLSGLTAPSLPDAATEKKTLTVIKPILFGFEFRKKEKDSVSQATLYGEVFKLRPYDDVGMYYVFKCGDVGCAMCSEVRKFHEMECFDFGANHLYRRYDNEKEAREKVREMCFVRMKTDFDSWFAMGTHSKYPFLRWMIVGLLWMKKAT